MGLFEKDYLIRLLEQVTEMKQAVAGFLAGGEPRAALAEIDRARRVLAGALFASLDRLDGSSVVALLGADKAREYAALLQLEAQARSALHEDAAAAKAGARAREIERAL